MVCWKRSTFPQVVGWLGLEFFWTTCQVAELLLEAVAAALASVAGEADCVDHPVVGQRGGGDAVLTCGFAEGGGHDGGGDRPVGGDVQGVAGVVVEPGDDLDAFGEPACVGEGVVGEVGLPGLVRHGRLEADVGGLGAFLRLGGDRAVAGQDAVHGGPRQRDVVVVFEVPGQGVGAGVVAGLEELFAQPKN